ncbi:MAG: ComF family protein [Verrucomicrobiales bacterium]|nr:ComF family protein [Verrucomicrobiales bacterium]
MRMKHLATIRQSLSGWIFPPCCAGCDAPLDTGRQIVTPFLCEHCEQTLVPIGANYCSVCGQGFELESRTSFRCANCGDRELAIDFAVSAYRGSGVAKNLMHQFKYGKQRHLSRLFGVLLDEIWRDDRLRQESWWVVPVPLHPRRLRERMFNQSDELAREIIRRAPGGIQLTHHHLLKRVKQTVRQAQLDRRDRLTNLSGVFETRSSLPKTPLGGARILLVDDVITTGTTVSECAAALRLKLDVATVAALSVLRG